MKIVGQNIPPQLAAEYAKLITNKPANQTGTIVARTTKKTHQPARIKKPKQSTTAIESAVDELIKFLRTKKDWVEPKNFKQTQISELKKGVFSGSYWHLCTMDSEVVYISMAIWSPFVQARSYAYPDLTNIPSGAIYPAGTISAKPLTYAGSTKNNTFSDDHLKWARQIYTLKNKTNLTNKEPIFIQITGQIDASANMRAARAMVSIIFKHWLVIDGAPIITSTAAPVDKPVSIYYRYKTPRGIAPYSNISAQIKGQKSIRSKKHEDASDCTKCVIMVAPMPMMGHRYNNNTSVNSSFTPTVKLWQIRKSAYVGWITNRYIMSANGTVTACPPPLWFRLAYFDGFHGIWAPDSFGPTPVPWKLMDDSMIQTPFVPPWETNEFAGRTYTFYEMWRATNGFTIFLSFDDDGLMHRFKIDKLGALTDHSDETTTPNIYNIIFSPMAICEWCEKISYYAQQTPNNDVQLITELGEIVYTEPFGSMVPAESFLSLCSGQYGVAVLTDSSQTIDQIFSVWEVTGTTLQRIGIYARAIGAPAVQYKMAYHNLKYYLFPLQLGEKIIVMDRFGFTTEVTQDQKIRMYYQVTQNYIWLGD